jgi:hypothetical protein
MSMAASSTLRAKSSTDFLADAYLASLLSLSVEALAREPDSLRLQEEALKQEVLDTAVTHYDGFIEAASCFREISGEVKNSKQQLEGFSLKLESLQEHTAVFKTVSRDYKVPS